jgi:CRISPR-associated protein Csb2
MIGISIQFLTGRYHATPWDKQVNEGAVEWPPSPWRIMRSMISSYYRSPQPPAKILVSKLLEKLAAEHPTYYVPTAVGAAHTQHYMPLRKGATTKIYDTFFTFPGGALSPQSKVIVSWPQVQMDDAEKQLLQQLCAGVSYLGRAESWAELLVIEELDSIDLQQMKKITVSDPDQIGNLQVLCPLSAAQAVGFCADLQTMQMAQKSGKGNKKSKNSPISKTPQTIMDLLELDITDLYQQGWNGIPGAEWVSYAEEKTGVATEKFRRQDEQSRSQPQANFARYVLSCPVLPPLTKAISVGERFRQSLMSRTKENNVPSATFSGKPSVENIEDNFAIGHEHAYYLPEINLETGKIEQVVVFSAKGFEAKDYSALGGLAKLWERNGLEIRTVLVSLGEVKNFALDFTDAMVVENSEKSLLVPIIGKSRFWRSLTPMVLPRHSRNRYIANTSFLVEGLEDQALRLLGQLPHLGLSPFGAKLEMAGRWLAALDENGELIVQVRSIEQGVNSTRSGAFQRTRYQGDGKRSSSQGYWLQLEFGAAQLGPISIGYAAHFGLGVFCPMGSNANL